MTFFTIHACWNDTLDHDEFLGIEDVIDRKIVSRDKLDGRNVGSSLDEVFIIGSDNEKILLFISADGLESLDEVFGLARSEGFIGQDDEVLGIDLVRQSRSESNVMLLLVHLEGVVLLSVRSEDDTAVSPDWRVGGTGSGAASAFLSERLAVGTMNDVTGQGVSSVDSSVGEIDSDSSLNNNFIDICSEEVSGKDDFSDLVASIINYWPIKIFVSHFSFLLLD